MQCTHGLHYVSLKWSRERIVCVSLAPLTRIRSLYTRRDGTREFSEFCILDIEFALVTDKIIEPATKDRPSFFSPFSFVAFIRLSSVVRDDDIKLISMINVRSIIYDFKEIVRYKVTRS